ncbi:MAG TPA: hypothetical protein VN887_08080 [Candidatus Angelobacter sp.]|nr:hypothetical protein [Candidatus Angelobacter sp.]
MKTRSNKEKADKREIRSVADFRKRFYPKPVNHEPSESPDPEEVGEKLAKESLDRLQAALAAM